MNAETLKENFLNDFRNLLAKYNADFSVEDDNAMAWNTSKHGEFTLGSRYDESGDEISPFVVIELGSYFTKDSK